MAYTNRKGSARDNANVIRSHVGAILPDASLGPVTFYWRHRVTRVEGGEMVQATVWSSKQKLQGRTADDGRFGFLLRADEGTKALADPGHVLPRPVYLDVVHMENVAFTPQISENELIVLAD